MKSLFRDSFCLLLGSIFYCGRYEFPLHSFFLGVLPIPKWQMFSETWGYDDNPQNVTGNFHIYIDYIAIWISLFTYDDRTNKKRNHFLL